MNKIDRVRLINHLRWNKYRKRIEHRLGDYTLLGIRRRWYDPFEYAWILCLFGIELLIVFKNNNPNKR